MVTSSSRKSAQERKFTTFQVTLAWVSITPLGPPLVPDVKGISRFRRRRWVRRSSRPATRSAASSVGHCTDEGATDAEGDDGPRRERGPALWHGAGRGRQAPCRRAPRRSCPGSSWWFTGARTPPTRHVANSSSRNSGWFSPSHATHLTGHTEGPQSVRQAPDPRRQIGIRHRPRTRDYCCAGRVRCAPAARSTQPTPKSATVAEPIAGAWQRATKPGNGSPSDPPCRTLPFEGLVGCAVGQSHRLHQTASRPPCAFDVAVNVAVRRGLPPQKARTCSEIPMYPPPSASEYL